MWLAHIVLAASLAVPSSRALDPAPFGCAVTPGLRFINACLADAEFEPQDGLLAAAVAALQDPQVAQTQGDAGGESSASEQETASATIIGKTLAGQPIEDFSLSTYELPARTNLFTMLNSLAPTAPEDAVSLEPDSGPIYVPPRGTVGWDFSASGEPVFIVRDAWNRLVWRRCDRDLTPLETRIIPGVPILKPLPHLGKGPSPDHTAIYLGQDRWLLAVDQVFESNDWDLRPTIYDSSTNQSVALFQLGSWLGAKPASEMEAFGDGRGGVLVASNGKLVSIDDTGKLRWRLTPDARADNRIGFRPTNTTCIVHVTSDGEIVLHAYGDSRIDVLGADGEWLRSLEPTSDQEGFLLSSVFALGPHQLLLTWVQARRSSRSGKLIITGPTELSSAIDVRQGNRIEPVIGDALGFVDPRNTKPNFYILQDWKSDGAFWQVEVNSIARLGQGGEVLERFASPKRDQIVSAKSLVTLLANGSAIVPDPDVLHVWSLDGSAVHATGQAVPSRFEVAMDANGAVWLSPVDSRGVSSGPAKGWAADGTVLGELFAGGRLAFDPSSPRVWSCASIEDQGTTLRLFDLDGTLLVKRTMYQAGETERRIEKVEALSVNDKGVASLWLDAESGSWLVRFGRDGEQLGAWNYKSLTPSMQPSGDHGDWFLATRTAWFVDEHVVVDLSNPDAPRYASVEDLVGIGAESFGFSPDGTEIWSVYSKPLSIAKRPLDKLRWRKL